MRSQESALFPLAVFLAVLLFALLAWCLLSSCMGRSIMAGLADLWHAILESARAGGGGDHVRHRVHRGPRWEEDELFELEHRGRSTTGSF